MLHALLKLQTRGELFPEPSGAEISFYPLGADCLFSAVINWIKHIVFHQLISWGIAGLQLSCKLQANLLSFFIGTNLVRGAKVLLAPPRHFDCGFASAQREGGVSEFRCSAGFSSMKSTLIGVLDHFSR
jgi:hypothetical protein